MMASKGFFGSPELPPRFPSTPDMDETLPYLDIPSQDSPSNSRIQGALRVRRLSIVDGNFRALVRQHNSSVELQLDSKKSGDAYAKEFVRGGFPSCGGLFDEPSQMFEFLIQALEVAQSHDRGVPDPLSDPSSQDTDTSGGLKCYVSETCEGAHITAVLKPQFVFVRPVEVKLGLPKVALATIQQKIAIQLQTQASMSQQLLAEQMCTFGKQVKEQRKQFETLVAEKLHQHHGRVAEETLKLDGKLDESARALDAKVTEQKEHLKAELAVNDQALRELISREMDNLRQELQLQLQLVRAEVSQVAQHVASLQDGIEEKEEEERRRKQAEEEREESEDRTLPKGVYYVHVKGWEEVTRSATSLIRSNTKPSGNSTTLFRVWTSGSLADQDELWMLLHSQLLQKRRQQQNGTATGIHSNNKHKPLRRIDIEQETDEHLSGLFGGKIGKKRLSSGSVTESGQLTIEFAFP